MEQEHAHNVPERDLNIRLILHAAYKLLQNGFPEAEKKAISPARMHINRLLDRLGKERATKDLPTEDFFFKKDVEANPALKELLQEKRLRMFSDVVKIPIEEVIPLVKETGQEFPLALRACYQAFKDSFGEPTSGRNTWMGVLPS